MRWELVWFFLVLPFTVIGKSSSYVYMDKHVRIEVVWESTDKGERITLNLISLIDILIPQNEGCFKLDTAENQCRFRNVYCPYYIITESSSEFVFLPKDSTVKYDWHSPKGKEIGSFAFEVEYIATTNCEYDSKRNRIVLMPGFKGEESFFIKAEDEVALRSRACMVITP